MIGWFVHGWGFGPSIWDELIARLTQIEPRVADLGYFGEASPEPPDLPAVWIAHSFGTMHALSQRTEHCRALVAVNGFDRFAGDQGVPVRVLDRMIARFAEHPGQVVSEFRRKCGNGAVVDHCDAEPLERDLYRLRDMDCREEGARLRIPVLVLHGANDPTLSESLRESVLTGARRDTHPAAGHLLPLEQTEWTAGRITDFLKDVGL